MAKEKSNLAPGMVCKHRNFTNLFCLVCIESKKEMVFTPSSNWEFAFVAYVVNMKTRTGKFEVIDDYSWVQLTHEQTEKQPFNFNKNIEEIMAQVTRFQIHRGYTNKEKGNIIYITSIKYSDGFFLHCGFHYPGGKRLSYGIMRSLKYEDWHEMTEEQSKKLF